MLLGRAQQADIIIGLVPVLHELIDEVLRREATEASVLWWNDDVEAAHGLGDHLLLLQSA
jgi:hypothetical protein